MSDISLAGRNEMPLSAMGAPKFRHHAGREEIFAELRRVGTMAVESRTALLRIEQLCRLHPEPNAAMTVIARAARDALGMTTDEIDSVCKILG